MHGVDKQTELKGAAKLPIEWKHNHSSLSSHVLEVSDVHRLEQGSNPSPLLQKTCPYIGGHYNAHGWVVRGSLLA